LDNLIRKREESLQDHKRWRALCKEEKTNFKSIFNEDKYRMTTKNKLTFAEIQDAQKNKDNLVQIMKAEDQEIEQTLCRPEGFILSGLPEEKEVLIQMEKEFMSFEFEDHRPRNQNDVLLNKLECCFGRKLRKNVSAKKRSIFDMVIILKSKFEKIIEKKLSKFEIQGMGKEVNLEYMEDTDKQHVAEFVNKLRVDDNVYALPSQFHANLKSIDQISQIYNENFKSNVLQNKTSDEVLGTLVLEIDDEQDVTQSIKSIEKKIRHIMDLKEKFYQDMLVKIDQREEQQYEELSKTKKQNNMLSLNSFVGDKDLVSLQSIFFEIFKAPYFESNLLKSKYILNNYEYNFIKIILNN
jgi:hypothetical protein